MTAKDLLIDELKSAREAFEGTVTDVTEKQLHFNPGGKALPLGATYAHLVFSEDVIVHTMLQSKKPLYTSSWEGKTGVSSSMPDMDNNWAKNHAAWAKKVKITLPQLRKYEKAVYAETKKYMQQLKNEDLEKEVDLGSWGKKTVSYLLFGFIIGHIMSLTGEISVLKGIQGAKGYPF